MFTIILYTACAILLTASFIKDRKRTRAALKKAWKSFENILPQFLSIILLIGFILALLEPEQINGLIGGESGWRGMFLAAITGSVTLIPGFVAFPLTAALYENGGGIMQLALFISTLMGVGIVTLPLEISCFGSKVAIMRNTLAFLFAFVVAGLMGVILI